MTDCEASPKQLEGVITTTAAEHGHVIIAGVQQLPLFTHVVCLLSEDIHNGVRAIRAGTSFPFSLPFPTYVSRQNIRLPPSYAAIHAGVSTNVEYHVQVDISRKGRFRRHEVYVACSYPLCTCYPADAPSRLCTRLWISFG